MIPLVDLRAQYASIKDEVREAIDQVLDSMSLNPGPKVEAFERGFADVCGANHVVGVGSGTDALVLALRALQVGPEDEVLVPALTFAATAAAVVLAGAEPRFVDISSDTFNIDPSATATAIGPRTKAIIAVHLYGRPAPMADLVDIANRNGLWLVEDCAQAHGASCSLGKVGSIGTVGCFSFYCTKNLGAYGEAGAVVTNNDQVAERVRLLRDHGSPKKYEHVIVGCNSRLDEIQAAVLLVKLKKLRDWNARRRDLARAYLEKLDAPLPFTHLVSNDEHVYHLFVLRSHRRDELAEWLRHEGIATAIHYPVPLHLQEAFTPYGEGLGSMPVAERVAREILSLPMYPELSTDQIDHIARAVNSFNTTHSASK